MNKLLSAFLLASLLAACGGGDDEREPQSYTCTATVSPVTIGYRMLGDDLLEVTGNGVSETYARLASGTAGRPVYGVWHVATNQQNGFTTSLDLRIEPASVSALADCDFGRVSADAVATAPASVTDDTISVLGSDTDTQTVVD